MLSDVFLVILEAASGRSAEGGLNKKYIKCLHKDLLYFVELWTHIILNVSNNIQTTEIHKFTQCNI